MAIILWFHPSMPLQLMVPCFENLAISPLPAAIDHSATSDATTAILAVSPLLVAIEHGVTSAPTAVNLTVSPLHVATNHGYLVVLPLGIARNDAKSMKIHPYASRNCPNPVKAVRRVISIPNLAMKHFKGPKTGLDSSRTPLKVAISCQRSGKLVSASESTRNLQGNRG